MAYIEQTMCILRQRYQELIRYIRYNIPQSAYAQLILNNRHDYGSIDNTMSLLKHINHKLIQLPHEELYIQTQTAYFRIKHQ